MRTKALLLAILLLGTTQAEARQDRTITSAEAVALAVRNSRSLQSARADADAAESALRQTRTLRLPALTASGSYTRLSENVSALDLELPPGFDPGMTTFELTPIELDQIRSEVSLSQPLFTGFRIGSTIASARHSAEAARLRARSAEVDAAYRVRQAFYRLVQAEASVSALESSVRHMEAHLEDARNRRDVGAATNAEILQIRTRLLELRADRVDAVNAVRVARMELNRRVGLPLETRTVPDTEYPGYPGRGRPSEDSLSSALDDHPGLLALEQRTAALDDRVSAVRADWFPDITAFGRYQYSRPNPYFFLDQDEFKGSWEAGVSASWTLWNWNRRGAAVDEARARLRGARAAEADFRETVALEVERRRLEIERADAALEAARSTLEAAEEAFRLARGEYELGAALTSQVLDAEAGLRAAEFRLAAARADRAMARAAMLQILGRVE